MEFHCSMVYKKLQKDTNWMSTNKELQIEFIDNFMQ